MFTILHALGILVADLFKSRTRLEAENLFLRLQLNIIQPGNSVAVRRAPVALEAEESAQRADDDRQSARPDRAALAACTRRRTNRMNV
jgi:hypothetical protein